MAKGEGISGESILYMVDRFTDDMLKLKCIGQVPQYQHKEHCQNLIKMPVGFDGLSLVQGIYERVESNWNKARNHNPSRKNWRFDEPRRKIADKNTDLEIKLERAIVNLEINSPPDYVWVNQVPTSSGLVHPRADGPRHIDLVHRRDIRAYEFIELKVKSNNPLYAAMEILQYGILYIFSRRNRQIRDADKDKRLLEARTIDLKVLAPHDYYKGSKLDWLEDGINDGLKRFVKENKCGFLMNFKFESFAPNFSLSPFPDGDVIKKALEIRRPIYPESKRF